MIKNRLFFIYFFLPLLYFSQETAFFGSIQNEDQFRIPNVTVFNARTEQKTIADSRGNFSIQAKIGDEIRFAKQGYERISVRVSKQDLETSKTIILVKTAEDLEEVEIGYQATGNLEKDIQHFGDKPATKKLKGDVSNYIAQESSPEVLKAKPGEFVQPVGPGFSVGKVDSQWDDVDFMDYLISQLGTEFFTKDLRLKDSEIQPFIYYIFRNFERKNILFTGICSSSDLFRFTTEADLKLEPYRKNLPNLPPKKKRRKILGIF